VQVVKPQALSLLTRPIEYRKRFGLCVTACLHVPFAQGEHGALWGEQSMWNFLAQEMGTPLIDEGVAKLTSEFLVHGYAYAPADSPNACAVRVRLGGADKTLLAFGDRYWDGARVSAPQPFEKMPLSWARAYGGADFPANPVGRGRAAVDGLRWLPNLELPQSRLLKPDQVVEPAGFGLRDVMHPQRVQLRGTYDASYLKEHSPGFAPDLDWRYFNLAPQDQWLPTPLRGDEPFELDNLHPGQAHIEGQLPGLRARVFASYREANAEPTLREVPLRLTTVWFFPHAERCILLYQGLAEVGEDDASDVVGLMGAVERLGEPKSDEHYATVLELRADPKMGAIHALRDSDLLPSGLSIADPDLEETRKTFAMEGLQADAQYRRAQMDVELAREDARAMGRDPDALGIKMPAREKPPSGDELAGYLERQMKEARAQQWQALSDVVTQVEKTLALTSDGKIDLAALQHRGPPRYSAERHLDELRSSMGVQRLGANEADVYAKLIQNEQSQRMAYLQSAHLQLPAAPMPREEAATLRDEVARAVAKGIRHFAGLDFTGADFSGLDLRAANFAGSWLEGVNFSKSNLSGANLAGAVLAHANLSGAVAIGADFSGANLGRALLQGVVMDDASLTGATLMHCALAGTQFRRAQLAAAMLMDTTWGQADWSGVRCAGQTFYKLDLTGMTLCEADLSGCNFIECNLSGVDLRGAALGNTTFMTCKLDGAMLQSVTAAGLVLVASCSLIKADFTEAVLTGCNFGASDLSGVRLVKARLDGANMSEAKLSGADCRMASAKSALFRRTDLRGSLLAGMNLQDAVLQHADLRRADLRKSNLFGADLTRVQLDGDVKLEGALLKRTRTWPRLTPAQQAGAT